jgi:xanthine dehydrogenase accessory factor
MGKGGSFTGTLDPVLIREVVVRFGGRQPDVVRYGEEDFLVEPLCSEGSVFIFGAGHIAGELAPLAKLVGFRTIVLDDRQEFASRARFPSADTVLVLDSFEKALDGLDIDEESYLVIVTRGHAHDKTVLGQALATKVGYIGMIGSRSKRDAVYEALLEEGLTRADFERVHSPIGLDIGAETPEEIAVSIVSELIQARSGTI